MADLVTEGTKLKRESLPAALAEEQAASVHMQVWKTVNPWYQLIFRRQLRDEPVEFAVEVVLTERGKTPIRGDWDVSPLVAYHSLLRKLGMEQQPEVTPVALVQARPRKARAKKEDPQ